LNIATPLGLLLDEGDVHRAQPNISLFAARASFGAKQEACRGLTIYRSFFDLDDVMRHQG